MAKKAKTKSASSSSSSSGESNTGLIVTLVFFILATLTLGLFTYFGYDGQKAFQEEAKKAKGEATAANTALRDEAAKRLVLAVATGNEAPGEQARLASVKSAPGYNAAVASLKDLKWDAAQDRPAETYQDLFARLRQERDKALAEKKLAESNLSEAKAAYDASTKSLTEKLAKASDDLKKANEATVDTQRQEQDKYVKLIDNIDKNLSDKLKDEKQERANDVAAGERDKKKLAAQIENIGRQLEQARSKIAPPNSLAADVPKGKILRIDREAGTVYVNLGSANFLKPQLTFSIYPPTATGQQAASRDRKGAVEIVRVLEPHLAMARITEQVNALREPILVGDLLFNPSWNSNQREHIALAGIFDLDGDGRDDTMEVIRTLERQGIVVDAYLDLRDRSIKGPGITERTSYLVAGERPELSDSIARAGKLDENPIAQAVTQINGKIAEIEKTAHDKGVQKVNYRRYLALVGYQLPKATRPVDVTATTYLKQAATAAKEAESADKPK